MKYAKVVWPSLVLALFAVCCQVESLKANGTNVCSEVIEFTQTYAEKYKLPQKRSYYEFCRNIMTGFRCLKEVTIVVDAYRTASRQMNRTVYQCCEGWQQNEEECTSAICSAECKNGGSCLRPEYCECTPGYQGIDCQDDVNECEIDNGECAQECTNEFGSYFCSCSHGYFLDDNGKTCSDHDECASSSHECHQRCINTEGSYSCSCKDGFELMEDMKSCREIDACASNPCEHICSNLVATYNCTCRPGYFLSSDSVSCFPICSQRCENGGYCSIPDVCSCFDGWGGHSCETPLCLTPCNHGNCVLPDTCLCESGWEGPTCNDDIDECLHHNGGCSDLCTNKEGSYECSCHDGFELSENLLNCSVACDPECEHSGVCTYPNRCECKEGWKGARCEFEMTKNLWTLSSTGCQCYFDSTRHDCACCGLGGCQCTASHSDKCVQCGYGHTCDDEFDDDNSLGIDGWTLSETGCSCLINKNGTYIYDATNNTCACCQHGGCPCGEVNPKRCMQCGQPHMCGLQNPWKREL